jgi:hypothetical protein
MNAIANLVGCVSAIALREEERANISHWCQFTLWQEAIAYRAEIDGAGSA